MGNSPVVRISKGHFAPELYDEIHRLAEASAGPLVAGLKQLRGLIYYHAGVDRATNTFVNVSVWEDLEAAKQMETFAPMLAQRPVMEKAGLQFDKIANYEPVWKIEGQGFHSTQH